MTRRDLFKAAAGVAAAVLGCFMSARPAGHVLTVVTEVRYNGHRIEYDTIEIIQCDDMDETVISIDSIDCT